MFALIGGLLGKVVGGVSTYVSNKQKISQAKVDAKIDTIKSESRINEALVEAKITMAKNGQTQDYNLDMKSVENMEKSYKDEYGLLLTTALPIWMAVESASPAEFIESLNQLPMWYIGILMGQFIVIYGLRGLLTKVLGMYMNSKNGFKVNVKEPIKPKDDIVHSTEKK